jgi:hypothetical protein
VTVEGTSITLTPSSSGDPNATTTSSPLDGRRWLSPRTEERRLYDSMQVERGAD